MLEVEDGGGFFLRSCQGSCPDIPLAVGEKVVLGRGPRTGKDRRLSRHQVGISNSVIITNTVAISNTVIIINTDTITNTVK